MRKRTLIRLKRMIFAGIAASVVMTGWTPVNAAELTLGTAAGENGIAIGKDSQTSASNSIVIGKGANFERITESNMTDVDKKANSSVGLNDARFYGDGTIAVGENAKTRYEGSVALGKNAESRGWRTVAIGNEAKADHEGSIALGNMSQATALASIGIGQLAKATSEHATAVGNSASATQDFAVAMGYGANASGPAATAVGTGATASSNYATAVGDVASATGVASTALGTASSASGSYASALGNQSRASGRFSLALGQASKAEAENSVAIGHEASVKEASSVAIGSGSVVNSGDKVGTASYEAQYNVFKLHNNQGTLSLETLTGSRTLNFAGTSPVGTVSVGSKDNERTITNVAAGRISATSTDAINGSQLYATLNLIKDSLYSAGGVTNQKDDTGSTGENNNPSDNGIKDQVDKNTGDIADNKKDIAINKGNIEANAESIKDNTESIKDLSSKVGSMDKRINRIDRRVDKVGAGAAALAALHPAEFNPDDKWDFAVGYGNYRAENAVAIGAFYHPNASTLISVGANLGNDDNMINAGVSFKLGQGDALLNRTKDVASLKAELKEMKKENEAQQKQIDEQKAEINELKDLVKRLLNR